MKNKILVSFLGLFVVGAMVMPGASFAQTSTSSSSGEAMQAQIKALLSQVANLQKQLQKEPQVSSEAQAGVRSQTQSSAVDLTSNLKFGDSGENVRRLQADLIKKGYVIPAGITGYYGSQTEAAVRKFRSDSSLTTAQKPESSTQTIKIISPAGAPGGQDLNPGEKFQIQWKSEGVRSILLHLCNLEEQCVSITLPDQGVPASSGSYSWYVDPNHPLFPGYNLRIKASDANDTSVFGYSGYFDVETSSSVPTKTTDLNSDGDVDVQDLLVLLSQWGSCQTDATQCTADFDRNNIVDEDDMTILLESWGPVKN